MVIEDAETRFLFAEANEDRGFGKRFRGGSGGDGMRPAVVQYDRIHWQRFWAVSQMSYAELRPSTPTGQNGNGNPRPAKSSQPGGALRSNGAVTHGKSLRGISRKDLKAVSLRLWPAVRLLKQAYQYAHDVGRDLEDFAVEMSELRRLGMTNTDCRWLVCKGWAYLLQEVKPRSQEARRFRHDVGLTIRRGSCVVLTPQGLEMARLATTVVTEHDPIDIASSLAALRNPRPETSEPGRIVPYWDRDRHELRLGSRVVKQFKLLSPNQEMILAVFDEENWPARIDDPLPPSKRVNSKQRLHDTIKNLNRNQKHRLLRFLGDGTGQGVRWELIAEDQVVQVQA